MARIQQTVEVNTPVHVAYNQLTQFAEYPSFMEDVEEVRQIDDTHLHWRARLGGKETEWDSEITEQIPDQVIAWRNISGQKNEGRVVCRPVADNTTHVTLTMDVDLPQQGGAGGKREAEGALTRRTEQDLARFKQFIESRGQETGAWRGEVRQGTVTTPDQSQRNQQGDTTMATKTGQAGTERQEGVQAGQQGAQQGGMQAGQQAGQGAQPGMMGASMDVGFSSGQQGQGGQQQYGQYQAGGAGQISQRGQAPGRSITRASGQAWLPNFFQAWEEPFAMMRRMTQEMDHMFERFMGRPMSVSNRWMSTAGSSQWLPSVDVSQRNNELVVCADLPGIRKEDVSVEIRNDQLTIEGERREESEQSVQGYHRAERSYGHFYRMIPLPEGVDAEHAQATMHDGVLEIKVPLPQSNRYGRRLPIQEAQQGQQQQGQQQYIQRGSQYASSQQGQGMQGGVSGQFQAGSEEQSRSAAGQPQAAAGEEQYQQGRAQQPSAGRAPSPQQAGR